MAYLTKELSTPRWLDWLAVSTVVVGLGIWFFRHAVDQATISDAEVFEDLKKEHQRPRRRGPGMIDRNPPPREVSFSL